MELKDSSVYKSTVENVFEPEEKKMARREFRSQVCFLRYDKAFKPQEGEGDVRENSRIVGEMGESW
jgi:hypothetical protein